MARQRHLNNAPITEAIIDLRVKARKEFDPRAFSELRPRLANEFPKADERKSVETIFEVQAGTGRGGAPVVHDLGIQGFNFKSADERTLAQFRVDGFTLNRLKPYSSWEELLPTALHLWKLYVEVAAPEQVSRVALRYINHIVLTGEFQFSDFLTAAPILPAELPQFVSNFLTRVTLHDPDVGLAANVAQALESDAVARQATVILDIDAYKVEDLHPSSSAIESRLRTLHDFKNLIFFSSITDRTASLYL